MKGDIITVSQTMDGGWWEGTLNGKTGWFPSNYVKELKAGMYFSILNAACTCILFPLSLKFLKAGALYLFLTTKMYTVLSALFH